MGKQGALDKLQEYVTVFFLSAGPTLGAAIAIAWVIGLILGLLALLTH